MAEIVSEQWIQVGQLEQAVQMTQVRVLKVKRLLSTARCPFGEANGTSVLEKAPHYLKRIFSAAKYYHHQLQGNVKQSMLGNEFTAVLANEEVVFFVVSALITFPILSICMLFSSRYS